MSAEDYFSSGLRHFEEAVELFGRGKVDEAAYLAGYVIECGLKKLIEIHMRRSPRAYGHDLVGMSGHALSLAALLAPASTRYRMDTVASFSAAMAYWSPNLRYWTSGDVAAADAALMLEAAREVVARVFVPLVLDGLEAVVR